MLTWAAWSKMRRKIFLARDLGSWRRDTAVLRAGKAPSSTKTFLVGALLSTPATLKAEAIYARTLQMRSYRPVFVLKDWSRYNVELLRSVLPNDLKIVTPGHYSEQSDEQAAKREADELLNSARSIDCLVRLEVDGIRVGRSSLSTVVRSLRAARIDLDDPDHCRKVREALIDSLLARRRSIRLLEDVRPDLALFNERGYTPAGELFDACLVRKIDALQWLGAPQSDHLLYKRYAMSNRGEHPLALSDETWQRLIARRWEREADQELMHQLSSHYKAGAWFNRQQLHEGKRMMSPREVRDYLRVPADAKIAVIFAHILYDATFFYGDSLFPDYASWLVETARAACTNPHVHWVVKVHPVNIWRSKLDNAPVEQLEARLLQQAVGQLPSNITLMPADTPINTYALFQSIDYGLTVRGTVGMELPCFGIPTVTAGSGRYSGRGFTLDPATADEYRALIARLHTIPRLSEHIVGLARRYAYGTFFLRPQKMDSFRLLFNENRHGLADFATHFAVLTKGDVSSAEDLRAFADFATGDAADFVSGGE
jgi:hypothetical protein